ncbi:ABC transporter ATP-binding protein [Streptococcus ferus]|uniref:ABC transporter ATP-binding protein n=1 Tax=Streptococcus ferus TaxID=1345 RepID=UPI0035A16978
MTSFIELQDFSFKYDAQAEPTLKQINLQIDKGQKVLIVGPSGSGKSTLAHCLNGLIPNTYPGQQTGTLTIGGKESFNRSIYEKSNLVSTVLQDPDSQFIGLTVAEDVAFALENDCLEQAEMSEKVKDWAQRLALGSFLKHRPQDLSGGQKQRVSLAGVLIDESPILLFDEPLANLDPKSGQETVDLIDKIHREEGTTTIIVEHRLEDVLYRSVDKIILINDGHLLFDGSPDELLKTKLLAENGIREPLYLTVLRQLGFDLEKAQNLADLSRLNLSEVNFQAQYQKSQTRKDAPILEVSNLHFGYQEHAPILRDLSLSIHRGERIAIVGKNGAGKSTLAKCLCQFLEHSGQLHYLGKDISQDSIKERSERIGYVLQNPNQMISQPMIFDEVALGLRLRGVSEEKIGRRVEAVLKTCGLFEFRKWPISALSFGQKKRVTIASILVLNPGIILLDEPTAGQDKKHYTEIMSFLDELNQQGHTIVMITHDMQLMLEYSDRALVIDQGQVIADLPPIELFSQTAILKQANLKQTSLFELAEKLAVDPKALTDYYIQIGGLLHG